MVLDFVLIHPLLIPVNHLNPRCPENLKNNYILTQIQTGISRKWFFEYEDDWIVRSQSSCCLGLLAAAFDERRRFSSEYGSGDWLERECMGIFISIYYWGILGLSIALSWVASKARELCLMCSQKKGVWMIFQSLAGFLYAFKKRLSVASSLCLRMHVSSAGETCCVLENYFALKFWAHPHAVLIDKTRCMMHKYFCECHPHMEVLPASNNTPFPFSQDNGTSCMF